MTTEDKPRISGMLSRLKGESATPTKRQSLQEKYERALQDRIAANEAVRIARERLDSYKGSLRYKTPRGGHDEKTRFNELTQEFEAAKEKLRKADADVANASDSIAALEPKKRSSNGWHVSEVLKLQQAIDDENERIQALQAAIDNHHELERRYAPPDSGVPALLRQREDVLSEIALGAADKTGLHELDEKISTLRAQEAEDGSKLLVKREEVQHTIAGLERKLAASRNRLAELKDSFAPLVVEALARRAQDLQRSYIHLGNEVISLYRQIRAIEAIARQLQPKTPAHQHIVVQPEIVPLMLPDSAIEAQARQNFMNREGAIFASDYGAAYDSNKEQTEATSLDLKQELRNAGVEI